jgi:DNA invertase Pin-like site-specific DNA recombinase
MLLDLGDTSTATGELTTNMIASAAQYERRLIGQRTREGLAAKRAAGVRLGRPPVLGREVVERIVRERRGGATLRALRLARRRPGQPPADVRSGPSGVVGWSPGGWRCSAVR